jgi:hypothetical protein
MRYIRYLAAATLVGATVGCTDLEVTNPNNPDRARVLASPADVEGLAAAQYQQIISATLGNIARTETGMATASLMNASTLANNGMGPRSGIPRQPIDNAPGNAYQLENYNDFRLLSGVGRNSADILARAKATGFTLASAGDVNRLRGFAHFISGVSHGYLSLVYDSAGVAAYTDLPADIPPLQGYQAVNEFALAQFDSALAYMAMPGTTAIPLEWMRTQGNLSPAEFQRIIRSFKARMRAGVARTPAERAAVNWEQVIADATNGIQADLEVRMTPTDGWDYQWLATTLHFRDSNWHQMTYYIIGMADVSGAYDAWLATPRDARTPFLLITPDLRFPQGATRAEQNADRGGQGAPTGRKYFRNRDPGGDQASTGWVVSQYDHYRFRAFSDAGRIGLFPIFTRAENDMLAAEGHIRRNNVNAAAVLIDRTRTTAGLPALSGAVTDVNQSVPGGANCVPRVPLGTNPTVCGNILEAMKWEKRMETAFTTYGAWFFDSRGWGDLPVGTAIHWPVPNQEANARLMPIYNMGGVGRDGGAGESTYGFGTGQR